jgi:hypothetical protein
LQAAQRENSSDFETSKNIKEILTISDTFFFTFYLKCKNFFDIFSRKVSNEG